MSISIIAPGGTKSRSELRGVVIGFGASGMVAAGLVAAAVPVAYPWVRFGVIALAVFLFAEIARDVRAVAAVVVIGFLISNGFLEDRFGQLAWHHMLDVWLLVLLIAAGAAGSWHVHRTEKEKHGA